MRFRAVRVLALLLALPLSGALLRSAAQPAPGDLPPWPAITGESRPWTRWWWMGSSVTNEGLTAAMEAYRQAGLGGLELTPIYGVAGYEDRFMPFLSPAWMALLDHTLKEAARLGLGLDMATGTGWPFGGPWVGAADACKTMAYRTYRINGGERLAERVELGQEPLVRSVGNQVYQLYGGILGVFGERVVGTPQDPQLRLGARQIDISSLVEPIAANKNLQALALDQVRFPKPMALQALMAYSDAGAIVDLTGKVDRQGRLDWLAPPGAWTIYAVFQGWHGKMVERAAPGGEGNVIDHFSAQAIRTYLSRFDRAFAGHDVSGIRAFFNDSYEVDDARGQADWTPRLFEEFAARRGYDLRDHLPALFGKDADDRSSRVLADYRQTVSDLLLETFTTEWRDWAHRRGAIVRNQAHGSPANILDLYGASDIPEMEGTDLLRIKFASSAAHVTGKRLVSSESATWLNDHFLSSLADVRKVVDRYFLGGVNHIVYHGTAYSPQGEPWPGWLFYAAVHFQPTNPFWADFAKLNEYVARVQSFLQAGTSDADVLLYFPIDDFFAERGNSMLVHFDGGGPLIAKSAFGAAADTLQRRGYAFDYVSDRQLQRVAVSGRTLRSGGASYGAVVVPDCRLMPLETFEALANLARGGATVIVVNRLPADVPGLGQIERRREAFRRLTSSLSFVEVTPGVREARVGQGAFLLGADADAMLARAGLRRESLVDAGLQFVRRVRPDGHDYFIANWTDRPVDAWVPLAKPAAAAAMYDPMSGQRGYARVRRSTAGLAEVRLQLRPGESCIVRTLPAAGVTAFPYLTATAQPQPLMGTWTVRFVSGGPELPAEARTTELGSWTTLGGEEVKRFSGTATYTISFPRPSEGAAGWILNLGAVRNSASVRLNGHDLGVLMGPDYQVYIDRSLIREANVLEISVSNLMANRIADMDRRGIVWKKFYNVNFPANRAENRSANGLFDASKWSPLDSGLLGPVTLTPVARETFSSEGAPVWTPERPRSGQASALLGRRQP